MIRRMVKTGLLVVISALVAMIVAFFCLNVAPSEVGQGQLADIQETVALARDALSRAVTEKAAMTERLHLLETQLKRDGQPPKLEAERNQLMMSLERVTTERDKALASNRDLSAANKSSAIELTAMHNTQLGIEQRAVAAESRVTQLEREIRDLKCSQTKTQITSTPMVTVPQFQPAPIMVVQPTYTYRTTTFAPPVNNQNTRVQFNMRRGTGFQLHFGR